MTPGLLRSVLPALLLAPILARAAASPAPEEPLPVLDTFVVGGERPGPALWKITRRDHTLWILPTFGPLPQKLRWKSTQLESVIRDSQEIYLEGRIPVERPTDPQSTRRMLLAVTNDEGRFLREVMPASLYEQFAELNRRYAGNVETLERFRPFQATDLLQDAAMARLGLTSDGGIQATIQTLAARYGVKRMAYEPLGTRTWRRMIEQLEATPREADIACTKARLDRLEADLRTAIDRANAWSTGDIELLREDPGLQMGGADIAVCEQFFRHMSLAGRIALDRRKKNFSSYERAIRKNRSTLVLAPIAEMFDKDGLIAKFRKAGYDIEEPGHSSSQ